VPVDALRWRKNACEIIGSVANENYQRAAWFGKSRFISSPEEVYNQVFGDLAFEEFVASPEVALNDLERAAAVALISKMLHFEEVAGEDLAPERVIDHPVWREVREAAQRVLDALQCPPSIPTKDPRAILR
jgi:hypothetical protein